MEFLKRQQHVQVTEEVGHSSRDSPACGQEILPVRTALDAAHAHGMSAEGRGSNSRRAPSLNSKHFESTLFHQGVSGEVSSKFQSSDPSRQSFICTVQQPSQGQNFYSQHLSAQVISSNIYPINCCSKALRIPAELHSQETLLPN